MEKDLQIHTFEFVSIAQIVCLNHAVQQFTFTIKVPQQHWKIICLVEDQTKSFLIWEFLVVWVMYSVHVPDSLESLMLKPTKQSLLDILLVSRGTRCMIWRRRSLLWVKMFNSLKRSLIILTRRLNQLMLIMQIWGSFSQIWTKKMKVLQTCTSLTWSPLSSRECWTCSSRESWTSKSREC